MTRYRQFIRPEAKKPQPRSKEEYMKWLEKRVRMVHACELSCGLMTISRSRVGTYEVRFGRTTYAQGRIPVSANAETYPLEIAKAVIQQLGDQAFEEKIEEALA